MNVSHLFIMLKGDKFYPSKLAPAVPWPLKILAETGQLSPRGRFKGQPSPYGMATIDVPELGKFGFSNKMSLQDIIEAYADALIQHIEALKKYGVEEIIFDIGEGNVDSPGQMH